MSDREGNARTHVHTDADKREFYFYHTVLSVPIYTHLTFTPIHCFLFLSFYISSSSTLNLHLLSISLFTDITVYVCVCVCVSACVRMLQGGILPGAWPLIKLAPSRQIHITATTLRTYKLFGPHNEGGGKWTGSLRSRRSSSGFYLRRDALAETPGLAVII